MRRDVIETIQGIEIFPLIALVIFFGFFIGLIYYVVKLRKSDVKEWSEMPLEEDEEHNKLNNNDMKSRED